MDRIGASILTMTQFLRYFMFGVAVGMCLLPRLGNSESTSCTLDGKRCYTFYESGKTHNGAFDDCKARGFSLLNISSHQEQQVVKDIMDTAGATVSWLDAKSQANSPESPWWIWVKDKKRALDQGYYEKDTSAREQEDLENYQPASEFPRVCRNRCRGIGLNAGTREGKFCFCSYAQGNPSTDCLDDDLRDTACEKIYYVFPDIGAYVNWAEGSPLNTGQENRCAVMDSSDIEYRFREYNCKSNQSLNYVCDVDIPPCNGPSEVPGLFQSLTASSCIFIGTDSVNWNKARENCQRVRGHLVTFPDETQHALIQNAITNLKATNAIEDLLWIGLAKPKNFLTTEGELISYAHFAADEPQSWPVSGCLYLEPANNDYEWKESPSCAVSKTYICEHDPVTTTQSPTTEPTTTEQATTVLTTTEQTTTEQTTTEVGTTTTTTEATTTVPTTTSAPTTATTTTQPTTAQTSHDSQTTTLTTASTTVQSTTEATTKIESSSGAYTTTTESRTTIDSTSTEAATTPSNNLSGTRQNTTITVTVPASAPTSVSGSNGTFTNPSSTNSTNSTNGTGNQTTASTGTGNGARVEGTTNTTASSATTLATGNGTESKNATGNPTTVGNENSNNKSTGNPATTGNSNTNGNVNVGTGNNVNVGASRVEEAGGLESYQIFLILLFVVLVLVIVVSIIGYMIKTSKKSQAGVGPGGYHSGDPDTSSNAPLTEETNESAGLVINPAILEPSSETPPPPPRPSTARGGPRSQPTVPTGELPAVNE